MSNPGKFTTLDTKLAAARTRSAKGDLANRVINYKGEKAKLGIMFDDYFKTSEEAGSLYRVEDLLNVVKVGDTVADLKRFINRWDATIAGMPEPPHENVLRDILLRQIRSSSILGYDIDLFDRAKEGEDNRSHKFLLQSIKDLTDRERLRENRSRIAERNKLKPGDRNDKNAAPAQAHAASALHRVRGRPTSREKGVCWAFLEGKCTKGKDCKFKHEKPRCDPSRRHQPSKEKKEQRDKSEDKERKKMTRLGLHVGMTSKGHADGVASVSSSMVTRQPLPQKRKDSPKPGKEKNGGSKNAAVCMPCLFGNRPARPITCQEAAIATCKG